MADYRVTVELESDKPLTDGELERAGQLGGVAWGRAGECRLGVIMTVDDLTSPAFAAFAASVRLREVVAGHAVAVEAMTTEEFDRRLKAGSLSSPTGRPAAPERPLPRGASSSRPRRGARDHRSEREGGRPAKSQRSSRDQALPNGGRRDL